MDRETEAAAPQAPAGNGLPPIFQRPTYPSGEPATRAPERAPEPEREPQRREQAPATGESTRKGQGAEAQAHAAPDRPSDGIADGPIRRTARKGMAASPRARRRPADAAVAGAAEEAAAEVAAPDRVRPAPRSSHGGRPRTDRSRTFVRTGHRGRARRRAAAPPGRTWQREPERRRPKEPAQTAAGQRDDAQPDEAGRVRGPGPARTGTSKRRGRRGGRGRKKSGDTAAATETPAQPERSRGPKTLEEQVASGGPTRGLRSRTLRGRGGGASGNHRSRRPGSPTSSWSSPSTGIGTRSPCSKRTCSCSTTSRDAVRIRWSATSTSAGSRTCCRGWKPRSSTSAADATACSTPARSTTRPKTWTAGGRRGSSRCSSPVKPSWCRSRRTRWGAKAPGSRRRSRFRVASWSSRPTRTSRGSRGDCRTTPASG